MRFIIGQGNKKREIVAPFGLCASRQDFEKLRRLIDGFLAAPGNGAGISYGILMVQDVPLDFGPPDTKPEPWE